ncbi:hypothetical protein [Salinibacter sp.]|uniref:hypothetical protein n=1 Tax=Salinibacter sp. TaxID=2065818 RepID=UPI0021E993BA|nr:hypothetical protein [Salinibacter sp.]
MAIESYPLIDIELGHLIALFVGTVIGGAFTGALAEDVVDNASHNGSVQHFKASAIGALIGAFSNGLLVLVLLLSVLIGYIPAMLIAWFVPWVPKPTVIILAIAIGLYPASQIIRGV